MKVLIADQFEAAGIDALTRGGCEVIYQPDLKNDALAQAIRKTGAAVLIVRSTTVTGAMLEGGSLSLVVRAGAGYNTIDVATASRRGIYVSNCPGRYSGSASGCHLKSRRPGSRDTLLATKTRKHEEEVFVEEVLFFFVSSCFRGCI